jgi:hypothetical protein
MHKGAAVVLTLMIASAAFGQQKNEFQVFISNLAASWTSNNGANVSAGFGVAYNRVITPRLTAQIAVTTQHSDTYSYVVNPDGSFRDVPPVGFNFYPIDLSARYNFLNDTRWLPYLGGGVRYVPAPNVDKAFGYQNHAGVELVGGTEYRISHGFGLLLDGRVNFGDHEFYDQSFKASVGLLWKF